MDNAELDRVTALLDKAQKPEEIFGELDGSQAEKLLAARKVFLRLAKLVHPDTAADTTDAGLQGAAFKKLAQFWEQAQAKINHGTYGDISATFQPLVIRTARGQWKLERLLTHGDICNLYLGSSLDERGKRRVLFKVPMQPQDNDLAANEAHILRHLRAGENYHAARHFVSQLVDAFPYEEQATGIVRHMTVLSYVDGLFSLKEVKEAYPQGIDVRDMAWIWRRLLIALDFAHTNRVIHGGVLPTHILIHPEEHGVVLIDWSYAVLDPAHTHAWIKAISSPYRAWYPPEVFTREEPRPGLDLFMASTCMIDLLGGDPRQQSMPESVPWQIQNHLRSCLLPRAHQRLQDVRILRQEFDALLERLWGPRTFHPFSMPRR
ncbi:MAG TPA: serine/threonine-protein kinase [Ktedonobacteraceae bacterium]|nr:serine/threonine-protein kinase [Ktedonobacteraceae bacterium]